MKLAARLALGAAIATLSLAVCQPASAAHVQCGDVLVADTTLDSDLLECPGNGLVIGAAGITLDLNGHTVDGTASGNGIERIADNRLGATIRIEDGTVRDFLTGVKFEGEDDGAGPVTLRHVTLADNKSFAVNCFI